MNIELVQTSGLLPAYHSIGLSYGITSDQPCWNDANGGPLSDRDRMRVVAKKLCVKGGGEDKFLRMIYFWWDVKAPRFWWQEADTYKVGTVAQSESTMHTIHKVDSFSQDMFEYEIDQSILDALDVLLDKYKKEQTPENLVLLKNALPEGFLQRRIWCLSLAQMKNIYNQRRRHRLPQWQKVCDAFYNATPIAFVEMYKEF